MYGLGVLESLFPEFGAVKARVIRDDYHQFTVDEHSLLAIKHVELLLGDESDIDQRFAGLLKETPESELLTLALLLHDVGKSDEKGHASRSADMAVTALKRLDFSSEKIEVPVESLLRGKETSLVHRRRFGSNHEPRLNFENDASDRYTIAEILAPDSIGLLYRIGREIAGVECNIELLLINTEGSRAVDVFLFNA